MPPSPQRQGTGLGDANANASDHELLQRVSWEVGRIAGQVETVLTRLDQFSLRFEQIGLKEQETSLSMVSLRSDFSRAMLSADTAARKAAEAMALAKMLNKDLQDHVQDEQDIAKKQKAHSEAIQDIKDQIRTWRAYLKIITGAFLVVQSILIAIIIKLVERQLFP